MSKGPKVDHSGKWQSALWIHLNLGVGPYAVKNLVIAGKLRTKTIPGRHSPVVYCVADVKRYLDAKEGARRKVGA